jgi:hypothetical protein
MDWHMDLNKKNSSDDWMTPGARKEVKYHIALWVGLFCLSIVGLLVSKLL